MTLTLRSAFADRLTSFVAYKRSEGRVYKHDTIINGLDRVAAERFPEKTSVDKELCMAWAEPWPNEAPVTRANRISVIREFSKYLAMGGEKAYLIPASERPRVRRKARAPFHVFSEEELAAFFSAADSLKPNPSYPLRHLAVPVYFRLLRCTGMRPKEARNLLAEDVDLGTGEVLIRESKGYKERFIALSDDLLPICARFRKHAEALLPDNPYFIPSASGGAYSASWVEQSFHACMRISGLDLQAPGPKIRPYDFRHTFATMRIVEWAKAGEDVEALMPLLMDYLGHVNPNDTYYYFHLVPHLFPSLGNFASWSRGGIVPEAVDYAEA